MWGIKREREKERSMFVTVGLEKMGECAGEKRLAVESATSVMR